MRKNKRKLLKSRKINEKVENRIIFNQTVGTILYETHFLLILSYIYSKQ